MAPEVVTCNGKYDAKASWLWGWDRFGLPSLAALAARRLAKIRCLRPAPAAAASKCLNRQAGCRSDSQVLPTLTAAAAAAALLPLQKADVWSCGVILYTMVSSQVEQAVWAVSWQPPTCLRPAKPLHGCCTHASQLDSACDWLIAPCCP